MLRDGRGMSALVETKPNKLKSEMNVRLFVRESSSHTFCTLSVFFQWPMCFLNHDTSPLIYSSPFRAQRRGVDLPSDFMFSRKPHRNVTSRKAVSTLSSSVQFRSVRPCKIYKQFFKRQSAVPHALTNGQHDVYIFSL